MSWSTEIVSQDSLILYFQTHENSPDLDAIALFPQLSEALQSHFQDRLIEIIPSYASILLTFNVAASTISQWQQLTENILGVFDFSERAKQSAKQLARPIDIPVYYSEQTGPDLQTLAQAKNLSQQEIIQRHSANIYTVYAMGFAPGFAYMGFVDSHLASPRLPTPRKCVKAGSIGIADRQTGIYPNDSPGGWNIIGRTAIDLHISKQPNASKTFPPNESTQPHQNFLFKVGDTVRFHSVSKAEYLAAGGFLDE
ncbi:Kinase A inhibitor [Thalassocella blandensis]|nr:Kinase A inhibitor [Thalassocella blandensis]